MGRDGLRTRRVKTRISWMEAKLAPVPRMVRAACHGLYLLLVKQSVRVVHGGFILAKHTLRSIVFDPSR